MAISDPRSSVQGRIPGLARRSTGHHGAGDSAALSLKHHGRRRRGRRRPGHLPPVLSASVNPAVWWRPSPSSKGRSAWAAWTWRCGRSTATGAGTDDQRRRRPGDGRGRAAGPLRGGSDAPGIRCHDSAPFDVTAGETAQVLVDLRLTFVAPSVEVRAPTSPTESVQPVSASDMLSGSVMDLAPLQGDDFQSLLPLLPGHPAGSRWPAPRQRRPAHAGRAPDQQHQPDRSLDRGLRSRVARAESRIGRAARQSLLRRIRPVFDQRGAASDQAWNQRVGNQAGQPDAPVSRRLRRHPRVRAAVLGPRAAEAGPAVSRAGRAVPLCQRSGEEPAR